MRRDTGISILSARRVVMIKPVIRAVVTAAAAVGATAGVGEGDMANKIKGRVTVKGMDKDRVTGTRARVSTGSLARMAKTGSADEVAGGDTTVVVRAGAQVDINNDKKHPIRRSIKLLYGHNDVTKRRGIKRVSACQKKRIEYRNIIIV